MYTHYQEWRREWTSFGLTQKQKGDVQLSIISIKVEGYWRVVEQVADWKSIQREKEGTQKGY